MKAAPAPRSAPGRQWKKGQAVGIYFSPKSWARTTYLVWQKLRSHGYAPTKRPAFPALTHDS